MDRWHAMKVFVKAVDAGAFAAAARQLGLGAPAVTRTIGALEQAIGARLFIRTTRALKLTEAGERYLADCRRILAEIETAEAAAAGAYARPVGTLTVTAPVLFGRMLVLPIVDRYLDANPAVAVRLLLLDRVTHLVDEGIDVAVRIGHLPDSGLKAIPVGSVRRVVCGAPAYFERHGVPQHPAELAAHAVISATANWTAPQWHFAGSPPSAVAVHPRLLCNNIDATLAAAIAGRGLVRPLSYQIAPAVEAGTLRVVLQEFEEPAVPIHVVHSEGAHAAAKVRAFVDRAVAELRASALIR